MASFPDDFQHTFPETTPKNRLHPPNAISALAGIIFMLCSMFLYPAPAKAETAIPGEYAVKAALIYSIAKFIDWPDSDKSRHNSPLRISVLGQDPFGKDLDTIAGKVVKGRQIVVQRIRRIEEAGNCEILFISPSEKHQLARILKQLQGLPVLTIADQAGFARAGVMINLTTSKNKVQFEINNNAATRSQLRISSQLLKLAKLITE